MTLMTVVFLFMIEGSPNSNDAPAIIFCSVGIEVSMKPCMADPDTVMARRRVCLGKSFMTGSLTPLENFPPVFGPVHFKWVRIKIHRGK